ncbi:hypothetical protein EG829_23265, partial [bacterium]|nr:hypothetical protein [bacterium]
MKASWLNLSFLRRQLKSQPTPGARSDGKAHDLFSGAGISRRRWLGVAGSTAVIASPGLKTIGSILVGPYELIEETTRVRFRLQGKDRWVVDTRHFAGSPSLSVARSNGDVTLRLDGSRFPGTSVPADFECQIHPTISGSEARFTFLFGSLSGKGAFEPWLLKMAAIELSGEADAIVTEFPREGRLTVQGRIEGRFHPSWQIDCAGKDVVSLSTVGISLRADACTFGLPDIGSESLLRRPPARRTVISI